MPFKVLKSSMDGLSGGASTFDTIEEVLREISYCGGWASVEALHKAIRKWAAKALPGDVFTTQVSAIVVASFDQFTRAEDECSRCIHKGLQYGEFASVKGGRVEQVVTCPECGLCWVDVLALVEQRPL